MPRIAVIGHVEYVTFTRAPRMALPGEILHLKDPFALPAGGGAVSAVVCARLGAETTFYTALGNDDNAAASRARLEAEIEVRAAVRARPQTQGLTVVDDNRERTILIVGTNLHPEVDDDLGWGDLATADAVYFTGYDPGTLALARQSPCVVVTARRLGALRASGVEVDALIGSQTDPGEQIDPATLPVQPRALVETGGLGGGRWSTAEGRSGTWDAVAAPGPVVDTYGAGDSFVAGVTYGLGAGLDLPEAIAIGARAGAEAVTHRGPYDAPG